MGAAKGEGPSGNKCTTLLRFVKNVIHHRRFHPQFRKRVYLHEPNVEWHGLQPHKPEWSYGSRLVATTISREKKGKTDGLYFVFNTSHLPTIVELPDWGSELKILSKSNSVKCPHWEPVVNTCMPAPFDFLNADTSLTKELL